MSNQNTCNLEEVDFNYHYETRKDSFNAVIKKRRKPSSNTPFLIMGCDVPSHTVVQRRPSNEETSPILMEQTASHKQ